MESTKGRKVHGQALEAQEKGSFLEALKLEDEAMLIYQEDGDSLGFSEIQAMRFMTLKHLFDKTDYKGYLMLAKHCAQVGVEIAEESGREEDKALPLGTLAKTYELLGDYKTAVGLYSELIGILQRHPEFQHSRKSVMADFKVDLETASYQAGDKSAFDRALAALKELDGANDASDYEKKVWLSNGYMRIAMMLKDDNRPMSLEYLQKAKTIIDSDASLKLRLEQWEKLAKEFSA